MAGQIILIRVNADIRRNARTIEKDNLSDPFWDLYNVYDGIKVPRTQSQSTLSHDIDRFDHVFIRNAQRHYQDVLPSLKAQNQDAQNKQNKKKLSHLLTEGNSQKMDKLEGLSNEVGNSTVGFMRNFKLRVDDTEHECLKMYGKQFQNFVKVTNNEFRLDHQSVHYFFQTKPEGTFYYRDLQGDMHECPKGILDKMGKEGENIKMNANGQAELSWIDEEGINQKLECLPIMNVNIAANVKFNEKNENAVALHYAFETYTDDLHYAGPVHRNEAPGLISRRNVQHSKAESFPLISDFPSLDTQSSHEAIDVLTKIATAFQDPIKDGFVAALQYFKLTKNKYPFEEIGLYMDFFKRWKTEYKPTLSFWGEATDLVSGRGEYKERVTAYINEWEQVILSCPYQKRAELLAKMQHDIAALKPKTFWQRLKGIFIKDEVNIHLKEKRKAKQTSLISEAIDMKGTAIDTMGTTQIVNTTNFQARTLSNSAEAAYKKPFAFAASVETENLSTSAKKNRVNRVKSRNSSKKQYKPKSH